MSIGVTYDQNLIFYHGFGSVNGESPNADMAYRIGSISKVFTAATVFLARDSGKVDLDVEIEQLKDLPSYYPSKNGITFRDLLSHRAGIARSTPCQSLWGECNVTLSEVIEIISKEFPPVEPIDSRPSYSNLGFALAGHLIANYTGTAFEDMVQMDILNPLNMTHTGYLKNGQNVSFLAPGYEVGGKLQGIW